MAVGHFRNSRRANTLIAESSRRRARSRWHGAAVSAKHTITGLFGRGAQRVVGLTGRHILHRHAVLSYSQEGEDLILLRALGTKKRGFYVDVGAHHPKRFSNTYLFYLRGWRGINIDAMPGSMDAFRRIRPNDINVEAAISDECVELNYYIMNHHALNSFDAELIEDRIRYDGGRIVGEKKIVARTLADVLTEYLPDGRVIDFLSIDVEGLDLKVLRSNDWCRYRPRLVLVECLGSEDLHTALSTELCTYLENQSYLPITKLYSSMIFQDALMK